MRKKDLIALFIFIVLFLLVAFIPLKAQENPAPVEDTRIVRCSISSLTKNTWISVYLGPKDIRKNISILIDSVPFGRRTKIAFKNSSDLPDTATGYYLYGNIKQWRNRNSDYMYIKSDTTGAFWITIENTNGPSLETGTNTNQILGALSSQAIPGNITFDGNVTVNGTINIPGSRWAQTNQINIWSAAQIFQDSIQARTKSVWGSGYYRALTLYGVAPSVVFWDSINNKAAGFGFDNGELRGYIGSSLSTVGTNWLRITTGQLSLINNAVVIGGSSYTGGGSGIQFVYDANPNTNGSQSLGSKDLTWAEAYLNGITTKMDSTGSNATMDFSSNTILITTGASDITVTLNNSSSYKDGREFRVKKVDDGIGKVIIVTANTGYIDGATSDNILSMNECKTYKKKGSNYYIIY